jgi:hypothetical protein
VDLLDNYFKTRFNLKEEGNSTILLKVFEDRRLLPFFYSKVIPVSRAMLAEGIVLPIMKNLGAIYAKSKKDAQRKKDGIRGEHDKGNFTSMKEIY